MNATNLVLGDCLHELPKISDKNVDMILCDLPYGITECKWDCIIPLEPLWKEFNRVIKDNSAIVLFANEPFTSFLIMSNLKGFKYKLTWDKDVGGCFVNANVMPMKQTEDICIFGHGKIHYYPIMRGASTSRVRPLTKNSTISESLTCRSKSIKPSNDYNNRLRYPTDLIKISKFSAECNHQNIVHPTQKPVKLFEYLIKTYTQENELVLDCCAGSGTTAIACLNINRRYICIEKEQAYFEVMKQRVESNKVVPSQVPLFASFHTHETNR